MRRQRRQQTRASVALVETIEGCAVGALRRARLEIHPLRIVSVNARLQQLTSEWPGNTAKTIRHWRPVVIESFPSIDAVRSTPPEQSRRHGRKRS